MALPGAAAGALAAGRRVAGGDDRRGSSRCARREVSDDARRHGRGVSRRARAGRRRPTSRCCRPSIPDPAARSRARASADRSRRAPWRRAHGRLRPQDELDSGGVLIRTAAPLRRRGHGRRRGRRLASTSTRTSSAQARRAADGVSSNTSALRPAASRFRACTSRFSDGHAAHPVSATWLGLYLAKRITRPVQQLAEGAARHRRRAARLRLEPETRRRAGIARRGVQHDGGRAADQPGKARAVAAATSSARTSKSTRAAATSRRFSSASRRASSRSTPPAASRP